MSSSHLNQSSNVGGGVESWLNSLPPDTANPSVHDLLKWKLGDRSALETAWYFASVAMRALSLGLAAVGIVISLVMVGEQYSVADKTLTVPSPVVSGVILIWDAIDLIVFCWRRGSGISLVTRIVVDLSMCLGALVAACALLSAIIPHITDERSYTSMEVAQAFILLCLTVTHFFLFLFFTGKRTDSRRTLRRFALDQQATNTIQVRSYQEALAKLPKIHSSTDPPAYSAHILAAFD